MAEERRAEHLAEIEAAFWGGPVSAAAIRATGVLALPSRSSPRCLVPADPRLASRALVLLFPDASRRGRIAVRLLASALRLPYATRLLGSPVGGGRSDSLGPVLEELTGSRVWAMRLSRDRANRKPVLLVLDERGSPTAWVKVGLSPLAARLVRHEGDVLLTLADQLRTVAVPTVLGRRRWGEAEVLALAPLPPSAGRPDHTDLLAGLRELVAAEGLTSVELAGSPFWRVLGSRLSARADDRSRRLADVWRAIDVACGDLEVAVGSCHGDWVPWNFAAGGPGLLVWDLERYRRELPVGLDAVHLALQTRLLGSGSDQPAIGDHDLTAVLQDLRQLGVVPGHENLVVVVYLLDICDRWIVDGQDRISAWGLVLDEMVATAETVARLVCRDRDLMGEVT